MPDYTEVTSRIGMLQLCKVFCYFLTLLFVPSLSSFTGSDYPKVIEEYRCGSPKKVLFLSEEKNTDIKMVEYSEHGCVISERSLDDAFSFHGMSAFFYPTGVLQKTVCYHHGVKQGAEKIFTTDGQIKSVTHYVNDCKEGAFQKYFDTGALKEKGSFSQNDLEGVVEFFDLNGNKICQKMYSKGQLSGEVVEWFSSGALKIRKNYQKGSLNGLYQKFYSNGVLQKEVNYSYNRKNGVEKTYFENGNVQSVGRFIKGSAVGKHCYLFEDGQLAQVAEYDEAGRLKGPILDYDRQGNMRAEYHVVDDQELFWFPGDGLKKYFPYDQLEFYQLQMI